MATQLPVACSLSAAELPGRLAEMEDLGRAALIDTERSGTRAALRFRPDAEIRDRLAVVVDAEAQCCAFLDMTLHDASEAVVLIITAPPEAGPVLDEVVAAFAAPSR